jgi:hypothetical protein
MSGLSRHNFSLWEYEFKNHGEYGVLVKKVWKSVITSWDMSFRTIISYMPTAAELFLSCRCVTRTLPIQRLLQVAHENAKPSKLVRMLLCNRVPRRACPRLSSQAGAADQPTNQR